MSPLRLYAAATPNNEKVTIMLAETATPFELSPVDLAAGEQHDPGFLALSPSGKTPALWDPDGPGGRPLAVFESGAILVYLAEKTGRFLPGHGAVRAQALSWTFWQMSALGPSAGQAWHFAPRRQQQPYAFASFASEGRRLWGVLEARLAEAAYLAGPEITIADMAVFPWIDASRRVLGLPWAAHPAVRRWRDQLAARPGFQQGRRRLRSG